MIHKIDTFPKIMEGEALFSAVAYYHLWSGNSSQAQSHMDLFGLPAVRAAFDLPVFIRALAERLPAGMKLGEQQLADRHTHLRYITAFMSKQDAASASGRLFAGNRSMHAFLGMASVVSRPTHLRFCRSCMIVMRASAGRLWWRMDHQLPAVFVCPEHGEVLRQSTIQLNKGQFGFIAASDETCPTSANVVIDQPDPQVNKKLLDIAVRSSAILKSVPRFGSLPEITDYYRSALNETDLMITAKQLDVGLFEAAWRRFYGDIESILAPVFGKSASDGAWVLEMARKHKNNKHPIQHILFQMFLDGLPKRRPTFGYGPWPCPNPMAEHGKGALTVLRVTEHNRRGSLVGTFECDCGYAYTTTCDPDGTLHGPRYRRYGPLLDPSLIRLVNEGAGLRAAADALGIHPRVVAEAAERLRLNKKWKAPERGLKPLGRARDRRKLEQSGNSRPSQRYVSQPRVDWAALDLQVLEEVEAAVDEIKALSPAILVSTKEIERRIGRGDSWIYLRAKKIPLTMARVKDQSETPAEFQERRLRDVIRRSLEEGELLSVSRAVRGASLKYDIWADRARELIAEIQIGSRLT